MKRTTLIVASVGLFLLHAAMNLKEDSADLLTAIRQEQVSVKAISTGKNAEEWVTVNIRNLTEQPLRLTIPSGLVFNTVDEQNQEILVTRPSNIVAQASQSASTHALR